MDRIKFLFPLCLIAFYASLTSCSHSNDDPEPVLPDGTLVEVKFAFGGEFVDVSEEPITRAGETSKKYYAMNVLKLDNVSGEYVYTAYGVFDDPTKMKIALETGSYYKFECTTIAEAQDKLATELSGDGVEYFKFPFNLSSNDNISNNTALSYYQVGKINEFCSSGDMHILGLGQGKSWVTNTETGVKEETLFPRTIRYYGELEDFRPELGKATINLNSAYCGLKVVVDNMPNGILTWKESTLPNSSPSFRFDTKGVSGSGHRESITYFTLDNVRQCWSKPSEAYASADIIFTWQPDGGIAKKYLAEINLKRNVMTVVKVELSNYDKEVIFDIKEGGADGEMTEDNPVVADPM